MSEKTVLPSTTGIRGQSVGSTAVCTVGKERVGLTYRGYAIEDLAHNASFEEVAYLLIYGALPNRQELISTLHSKPSVALKTGSPESIRSNNGRVNAFRRDRRGLVVDGFSF